MSANLSRIFQIKRGAFCVWRRNLKVWSKLIRPAVVMHFGEPLIYLLGMGLGLGALVGTVGDLPYMTFFASGLIASAAMSTATLEGTYSAYTRMVPQQTYQGILNTPIEIEDIMLGEILWCATKALFSGVAILIVATLLGAVTSPWAILTLPIIFLAGLCFSAPALLVSTLAPSYDFFNYYLSLVMTPMFVLCGVFYPVSTLPEWLQSIVIFLPLTHAVALIRPMVTGESVEAPLLNLFVLVAYAGIFYVLATLVARRKYLV